MTPGTSIHASQRMQQRGITPDFLSRILEHADIERAAGDNCRLYRVARSQARALGDERLSRFAVIFSDTSGVVVTVLPVAASRSGARYRRAH